MFGSLAKQIASDSISSNYVYQIFAEIGTSASFLYFWWHMLDTILFIKFSISILFALAIDNLLWIPGSPEWKDIDWKRRSLKWKLWWAFRWRFMHVIFNPVDIGASIIGGLILSLIW